MLTNLTNFIGNKFESVREKRKTEIQQIIENANGMKRFDHVEYVYGSYLNGFVQVEKTREGFYCHFGWYSLMDSSSVSRTTKYSVLITKDDSLYKKIKSDYKVYTNKRDEKEKEVLLYRVMQIEEELVELNVSIYQKKKALHMYRKKWRNWQTKMKFH